MKVFKNQDDEAAGCSGRIFRPSVTVRMMRMALVTPEPHTFFKSFFFSDSEERFVIALCRHHGMVRLMTTMCGHESWIEELSQRGI